MCISEGEIKRLSHSGLRYGLKITYLLYIPQDSYPTLSLESRYSSDIARCVSRSRDALVKKEFDQRVRLVELLRLVLAGMVFGG